jgi:hypothetical protein
MSLCVTLGKVFNTNIEVCKCPCSKTKLFLRASGVVSQYRFMSRQRIDIMVNSSPPTDSYHAEEKNKNTYFKARHEVDGQRSCGWPSGEPQTGESR